MELARNELSSANAELFYLMGFGKQNSNIDLKLTDSLIFIEYDINKEQLYNTAKVTNPEIKIAELNNKICSVENAIAWSSLLPNINIAYFNQTREGNNFYGTSVGISVPLWFMFEQNGKIQETKALESMAYSEIQSVKNEICLKLQNAINNYENNLKQVKLYINDILPQTDEIFSTAVKSYEWGEITYMEYLQAKQTLINSKNNYVNVLLIHFQSLFGIEEIVGSKYN